MAENVINQHYIPQCVLKHFSSSKNQLVETLVELKRVYKTNYRQSMSARYTYEHSSLETNKLEKYFSRIEGYFSDVILNILNTVVQYEDEQVEFNEIKMIVERYMREFIIFYYRSGALLHEFSFLQENEEIKINHLLSNIMNSSYIRDLSKTIITHYNISIIKSEDMGFLLSDQYVSTAALGIKGRFANVSNRHLGFKDVIILIPLSSQYYIVYYDGRQPSYIKPNTVNILNGLQVKEINKVIINNTYRKCISYQENSIREALKEFELISPCISLGHYSSGLKTGATLKKEVFFYESDKKAWDFFVSFEFVTYQNSKRNDVCPCKSGKKFKKCCLDKYNSSVKIIRKLDEVQTNWTTILVSPQATSERGIAEFSPQQEDPRDLKYNIKSVLNQL
ncbi:DUF4238 domain-containing protein [Priestia megaterium]|uniref:DUF4238 domain-containing protein n=1 Tax=Priestia megaterium TaxID=1404 RepID=UPI002FFFDB90